MTMDLLDRYVHAVKTHLLPGQGDDIAEELGANLQARIDDREAELGRSLNDDELEALLKEHGHPRLVAARYRPRQYLIGPVTFPYYWTVLQLSLSLVVLVYAIASAVAIALHPITAGAVAGVLLHLPAVVFSVFAWVTLAFAVLDYGWQHYVTTATWLQSWSPRSLPAIDVVTRPSRAGGLFDFLASLVLTTWVVVAGFAPAAAFGLGAVSLAQAPVHLAPALRALYWPIVGALALQTVIKGIVWFRGSEPWHHRAAGLAYRAISASVLVLLLRAGAFVVAAGGGANPAGAAGLAGAINGGLTFALRLALLIVGIQLVWSAARAWLRPATRFTSDRSERRDRASRVSPGPSDRARPR